MRNKKLLYAAASLLVLYALAGFLALPAIVKPRLIASLERSTGRSVSLGALRTNPFSFSLTLDDFRLLDRDSSLLVSFKKLYVRYEMTSLFRHAWALAQLHLDTPFVAVRVLRDGRLSVDDLLNSGPADTSLSPEAPRDLEISDLFIGGGTILYQDFSRAEPMTKVIDSLDLALKDFTTAPRKEGVYEFEAVTKQDERLHWKGNISLSPLRSSGLVELAGIHVRTLTDFMADRLRFHTGSGSFSARAEYAFDGSPGKAAFALKGGRLDVSDLVLTSAADSLPFLSLPSLHVGAISMDMPRGTVTIDEISTQGGDIRSAYLADGTMTLQELLTPVPRPGDTSSSRMEILVRKIGTKGLSFLLTDRTRKPEAPVSLTGVDCELTDFRYGAPGTAHLSAGAVLNGGGTLRAGGTLSLEPRRVDLDLEIAGTPLGALAPYVARHSRAEIRGGTYGLRGKFSYAVKGNESDIRFSGGLSCDRARIGDPVLGEDLIRWDRLEMKRLDYRTFPPSLQIAEIVATRPYARVIIGRDKALNLQHLRNADSTAGSGPADTSSASLTTIGAIRIKDGSINFADLSLTPSFATGIQKLEGSITRLSSKQLDRADVDLAGSVDSYAPVSIKGEINPLSDVAYTDILMTFNGIELTTFTPYFSKFAGYKIERGKMTMNLRYKLNARHLDAENKIVLNQLTLGEKVESPDATSLPVKLAIALLKDSKGLIDLDIPVSGSLDDPEFSIFPIVLKVLMNLLWKIVTAPFALLGSLFGGGGDDLQFVTFAPGADSLAQDQYAKLQTVAKGLTERPALELELRGVSSPLEDRTMLAEGMVLSKVRTAGRGPLTRQEEKRLLEVYRSAFKEDPEKLLGESNAEGAARDSMILFRAHARLIDSAQVSDNDLRALAQRRAATIREYVAGPGRIDPARIFLDEVDTAGKAEEGQVRVKMTLTVR